MRFSMCLGTFRPTRELEAPINAEQSNPFACGMRRIVPVRAIAGLIGFKHRLILRVMNLNLSNAAAGTERLVGHRHLLYSAL